MQKILNKNIRLDNNQTTNKKDFFNPSTLSISYKNLANRNVVINSQYLFL